MFSIPQNFTESRPPSQYAATKALDGLTCSCIRLAGAGPECFEQRRVGSIGMPDAAELLCLPRAIAIDNLPSPKELP
jgi:hypothetical protein